MKTLLLLALPALALPQSDWQLRGNIVFFESKAGSVELQWLSPSAFRFQRCRGEACPSRSGPVDHVEFTVNETPATLEFRTQYLVARFDRITSAATIRSRSGRNLLTELNAGSMLFQAAAANGERFHGLGARTAESLDLRGQKVTTSRPFLMSSAGYGIYFAVPAEYTFDFTPGDRFRVTAPFARRLEYYFYYGPDPKEILEEHVRVYGSIAPISRAQLEILPPAQLPRHATAVPPLSFPETLRYMQHAALTGVMTPAVDIERLNHPAAIFFPLLIHADAPAEARRQRARWQPYLYTYLDEAQTRGLPMLRPILMQYPDDPQSAANTSAFMIGDELLIPAASTVRLPMGLWTDLCTNTRHAGRRVIEVVKPGACPLAHNGSIVPIAVEGRLELHYYPRLGAEFFLVEDDDPLVTQIHAGPAAEYLRLEIESRVARDYEWVVHHVSAVDHVACTGCTTPPTGVRYDDKNRNFHVRVQAPADSGIVLNLTLREPL